MVLAIKTEGRHRNDGGAAAQDAETRCLWVKQWDAEVKVNIFNIQQSSSGHFTISLQLFLFCCSICLPRQHDCSLAWRSLSA
jgi:hypothetical protein